MDSLRGFDEDAAPLAAEDEPAPERPPEIGVDERRMHVRAYNYWVSLLKGRAFPSIEDVEPESIADFGPHSVLLDFSANENDPRIAFLGGALKAECEMEAGLDRISCLGGLTNPERAPYWPNPAILRAVQFFPEKPVGVAFAPLVKATKHVARKSRVRNKADQLVNRNEEGAGSQENQGMASRFLLHVVASYLPAASPPVSAGSDLSFSHTYSFQAPS